MNDKPPAASGLGELNVKETHPDFPVIGIGASAGGVQALLRFFENMPGDSGMAFVVVMHLSPDHASHVDDILRRATTMPTVQVNETTSLHADHVYIMPPSKDLRMHHGELRVAATQRAQIRPAAIDLFFRTLAEAHGTRAVAILLSGTGADGSIGMARIKEQGGITIAQLPEDAEFGGMPLNAIESNVVDFVMPVSDIPRKLLELSRTSRKIELPPAEDLPSSATPPPTQERAAAAESALTEILNLLTVRTGHDFSHYKRATILRRIERRMQVTAATDMPMYREYLDHNPEETGALLDDMLIGVTNFFRDREAFVALERDIVPELFNLARDAAEGIRAWVAGCSTGEEAYSLAMVLASEADERHSTMAVQVFGSDIDERAISVARRGLYPDAIVTDIPPNYLQQYFKKESGRYRINRNIRERILFAVHDVLRDPPFSRLHLISCRNLLIYLDRRAQLQALRIFHAALRPGGYLFLGSTETIDAAPELFSPVDKKHRIYRSLPSAERIRPMTPPRGSAGVALSSRLPTTAQDHAAGKPVSYAALHQRALELHGPATLLIMPSFRIVHMSEKAARYLRHVGGEPSHNLLALIHPEMRLDLRTAALDAMKTGRTVETRLLPMRHDGRDLDIKIVASPFYEKNIGQLLLVVLEEFDAAPVPTPEDAEAKAGDITHLHVENKALRHRLQQTIEQFDTSTEELKESNEELQAVNEELRSATEELETSKEELQSVNEELVTVNAELRSKVEETIKINDDLQNLISSSDIATIFVDRSMRIKWFTPKATTLFSLIPEDRNRPLTDITHSLYYPAMIADAKESFSSLRLVEREVKSVDEHWHLVRIVPYRTAEDRIEGAILNFVDITSRKRAEQRLEEGLQRMRLVSESTKSFAIITTDPAGTITDWNAAAEILFGYSAAEAIGQPLDIIFTPEDRAEGVPARERQTALERGHADDERWHIRKDGSRFFCSGVVHPMVDSGLRGFAKIARDLTDKRIQDYEQHSILERTRASNVLKDEFIAIMSHELRHPLNLIQLNMDLLSRTPGVLASPRAVKAIEAVRRSVRSQSQLIADLLDLSRVQTGKLKLECTPIRLIPIVTSVLEAVSAQAAESRITLQTHGLDFAALNEVTVRGDATRIEQIIWNLLNNAIKFTPEGGTVTVTLTCEKGELRLDVKDTGIGIPADSLDKVFTMFGQVERQHGKRNQHGLGIGLALVAQLTKAHGGRVSATSEGEGKGATFSLWLPVATSEAQPSTAKAPEAASRGMLHDLKLLLVDDSSEVVETLGALCELEGAKATIATSGREALDLLAERDFDILVSDIGMPDIDGYELLTRLRASPRNTDIPALALSGFGHSAKAESVGYAEQLCKPVSMTELLSRLQDLARRANT